MRGGMAVWRALERARALNLEAAGEAAPVRAPDGITRRRLLLALGGGALAAALPRSPAFAAARRRVIVIGGGLAGLSALARLRERGVDASLYEARAAVGGRTRSVRGVFAPDYAFDEGGQLVNSDHKDMIALVRKLGLKLVDRRSQAAREMQLGRDGKPVAERELAEALRGIAAAITADADRLDKDYAKVGPALDLLSAREYLELHGLLPGAARDALEATIRTEYGVEPERASAIELIFNQPTVDGQRVTRLSNSDERYVVAGGAGQVAQALGQRLQPFVHLGKKLETLALRGHGVQLVFADGEELSADRVILALPAPLLREVRIEGPLPPLWRQAITEVDLGRNEKVIAGYDAQPWRRTLGDAGALWSPTGFSAAWDAASTGPRPAGGPGALTWFLGGGQVDVAALASASDLAGRFTAAGRAAVPGLPEPNGRFRRTQWHKDPLSKGAYINFRPGQLTRFASLLSVEGEGKVRASSADPIFFAGEWLSDAWPGYMNGAVQTGRLAADAAAAPVRALAA